MGSARLLLLLLLAACAAWGERCDNETIHVCMKPLNSFKTEINEAVVVYLDEPMLKEHCRLYEEFSSCMDPVRGECSQLDQLIFLGMDDSYHYLCDERLDVYLKHRHCFNDSHLHAEGEFCNNTLSAKLARLDPRASFSYRKDRVCQYAGDYLDCVENAVESFCGPEAGAWQRGLDERSLRPLLATMQCPGYGDDWWRGSERSSWALYVIVGGVVLALVIGTVLVVFMVTVYRKRKQRRRRRAAADGGPYVSYGGGEARAAWAAGEAGPVPPKGQVPPPYSPQDPGGPPPGVLPPGVLPPAGHPAALAVPPPAYTESTPVRGLAQLGYDNPVAVSDQLEEQPGPAGAAKGAEGR